MRHVAAILVGLFLVPPLLCGDTAMTKIALARSNAVPSRTAAIHALSELVELSDLPDLQHFELLKSEDRQNARIGGSFPIFTVQLDQLRTYDSVPKPDPLQIVIDTKRVLHLVVVSDKVVSAVEVINDPDEGGWTTARLGAETLAQNAVDTIATLRAPIDQKTGVPADQTTTVTIDQTMLVEVPAMRLTFVAFDAHGSLMLASIADASELGIKKGAARSASELFLQFAPLARNYDATRPN